MKKLEAIIAKEWMNFLGSERGVFAVYAILILSWSFLPLYKGLGAGHVWWLFFSVVISGNFTNTVFVSERLSGSMEILLTSGFSRDAVLWGKSLFIIAVSCAIGLLCVAISRIWVSLWGAADAGAWDADVMYGVGLYCAGTCMNVGCGAWTSVRLQSPRLIPFVGILLMSLTVAGFSALLYVAAVPQWALVIVLLCLAIVFFIMARKDFNGERIIQPIHL
jgi:ABC-type Na+ efflux pump permease subunit